jgi:2-polyprenyl-3-methyl-5-hydroxy-6-metoxy-1,4-benzoquinol methylase
MNPRPSADVLAQFYACSALYEYWNTHTFPASRDARRSKIFRPRVQRIADLCRRLDIATDTIVDVGAATGAFCEEAVASRAFKRVVAIEPGRALAQTCRDQGIETIEAGVESAEGLGSPADIITSFETIEHVFSPRDFLGKCARLLRPNGLLVLTCPNYAGFDIQALGVESESLDAEHINLFNPASLALAVESIGFSIVECSTPGQLDAELVRRKVLDGRIDLADQPFLRTVLVDRWDDLGSPFQEFLANNRLSSHMWLTAQRTSHF